MGMVDLIWLVSIVGGSAWLLWRFLIKERGSCPGCQHGKD